MKRTRELAAAVFLPLFYLLVMKTSEEVFLFFVFMTTCLALWEFYSMYGVGKPMKLLGTVFAGALHYSFYLGSSGLSFSVIILFILLAFTGRLFSRKGTPDEAMKDLGPVVTGFFYVPLLMGVLLLVRRAGPEWILFLAVVVWSADSTAYYMGRNLGRRKLYPSMSPKKTVEGAMGSVIGGCLSAVLMKLVLVGKLSFFMAAVSGSVIGVVTMVGDLVESMFKRDAGVKDSSTLIPGHGGILDKVDGFLFVIPLFYLFLVTVVF
jgi:phosphatidate cytidylyltransferase